MEAYVPVWPGLACREWDASPSPFSSRRWLAEIVRTRGARESPWAVVMRNIPLEPGDGIPLHREAADARTPLGTMISADGPGCSSATTPRCALPSNPLSATCGRRAQRSLQQIKRVGRSHSQASYPFGLGCGETFLAP